MQDLLTEDHQVLALHRVAPRTLDRTRTIHIVRRLRGIMVLDMAGDMARDTATGVRIAQDIRAGPEA